MQRRDLALCLGDCLVDGVEFNLELGGLGQFLAEFGHELCAHGFRIKRCLLVRSAFQHGFEAGDLCQDFLVTTFFGIGGVLVRPGIHAYQAFRSKGSFHRGHAYSRSPPLQAFLNRNTDPYSAGSLKNCFFNAWRALRHNLVFGNGFLAFLAAALWLSSRRLTTNCCAHDQA